MGELVTKKRFAEVIGLSRQRITQLAKDGLPVNSKGRVPLEDAIAWYRANYDAERRGAFTEGGAKSSRQELDSLKVEREKLALEKDKGSLVDREQVRKALFQRARSERDAWIAWASRMAAQLAAEAGIEPGKVFAPLDREIRQHLKELADAPMKGISND